MSDDLVKRLRGWVRDIHEGSTALWAMDQDLKAAADRIEELEAANKRLNEQMDAIEEMGTESLNALPDCLMRLAPALVENDELKAKLAKVIAAYRIEAMRRDDYNHDAFDQHIAELKGDTP